MLTEKEQGFIDYWEDNRSRKKKVRNYLSVGLPLAVVFVITIFMSVMTRWHKAAYIIIDRKDSSLVIVLLAACLLIVAFIVIFSARYHWERNEQYYRELLAKK